VKIDRRGAAAVIYGLILLWINLYIARDFFHTASAPMNSMHGYWTAIAQRAGGAWFQATWWPYVDAGIPFEFTYAPGIPFFTAMTSAVLQKAPLAAFNMVAGAIYCLAPLTVFLMAWLLMRAPGYALLAGLLYSLTSTTQILAPDGPFAWRAFWDARRIYLTAVWDDTPHLAAIALLPIIIVLLARSIQQRRLIYYALAALTIALASWCSAFGPTDTALATICLLFTLGRERLASNVFLIAGIGLFAWALTAPFLSPAIIQSVRDSSSTDGTGWQISSFTALAIAILGWTILWRYLQRWTGDWRLRFAALFAYLMSAIPMIAEYLHRQFLPQPTRYKLEMEMALDVCLVFALKPALERVPRPIRAGLLLVVLAFAGEQLVAHRRFERAVIPAADLPKTIESRVSLWAAGHLPGTRIAMPGSIAMWANLFSSVQQFGGGAWSMAYNMQQQHASWTVQSGDPHAALTFLKAFGVGAICVSGPKSPEFWKTFGHPERFESLPVLWREDDTTIYANPGVSASLAHSAPVSAIVRDARDFRQVERYVNGLQDDASLGWRGNNEFEVHAPASAGRALSVQVSWSPGWRAAINGKALRVQKDGLGLMWFEPQCAGACEIDVRYDGGWQLRILRWLSFAAMAALVAAFLLVAFGKSEIIGAGRRMSKRERPENTEPIFHRHA
jgi:hypothetical protein